MNTKTFKITAEAEIRFSKIASTFAYVICKSDEANQRVFIAPVSTLKTGKATTFAQEAKNCQWVKASSIELIGN